jgi:hypothetical protein
MKYAARRRAMGGRTTGSFKQVFGTFEQVSPAVAP